MQKTCTLCGDLKPTDQFYKARGCKDGLAGQCMPCVKKRARIRHFEKRDQIRAYDRQRAMLPHRKLARAKALIKQNELHPERTAARIAVGNAVRDGRLLKMDCAFCGSSDTVAHHHDYSAPLDVTWLCTPCHTRFHALELMSREARSATPF